MHIDGEQANNKKVGPMNIKEYKLTPKFSGTLIEIDGNHGKIKNLREDRVYYIVDGSGTFIVGNEEFLVKKDDVVFIPMNTIYNFVEKMKIFLVSSPEFKKENDVFID